MGKVGSVPGGGEGGDDGVGGVAAAVVRAVPPAVSRRPSCGVICGAPGEIRTHAPGSGGRRSIP
jgi:hypothetical protein